jgi:glycosyltransferase involved in cell wall biosynthesis
MMNYDRSAGAVVDTAVPTVKNSGISGLAPSRKLKILQVIEACGGGSARHAIDLSVGLVERGHHVDLVYSPIRSDERFRDGVEQLRSMGVRCIELSMERSIGRSDLVCWWQLRRIINREGDYDIVHGQSSKAGALARMAAVFSGSARVYTTHALITMDPMLGRKSRKVFGLIERYLSRHSEAIITNCEPEREMAIKLGLPAWKVTTIYNGVPENDITGDRAEVRKQLRISDDKLVIGFVGRIAPQKAPEIMLASFYELAAEFPNLLLVMVGSGPDLVKLKEEMDARGVSDRILRLGDVNGRDFMPAFDIFALSSRYESCPYVLLEAMSAGLPIVTTDVGSASAMVHRGENGLVVPVGDVGALTQALRKCLGNDQLRLEMGRAGREKVQCHSIDVMVDKTIHVYMQALATKKGRRSAAV